MFWNRTKNIGNLWVAMCWSQEWVWKGIIIQISTKFSVRLCYPMTMKSKLLHLLPMKLFILFWQTWVAPRSPLHSEYVPLAEEQGHPTSQCQHLQRWGWHTWTFWAFRGNRDWSLWRSVWSLCKTGNWWKLQSWGEDLFYSVQWEGFIQSALLAEKRCLFKGLICTSVSCILYKEALLWNSKPICVSAMHNFRQRWDLQCQGSWDRTCLENYIGLCISGSWHSASQSSPLLTGCFS